MLKASTKLEKLRCGLAGARAYALKYALKSEQKEVPDGFSWYGRWWGVRGQRSLVSCRATFSRAAPEGAPIERLKTRLDELLSAGKVRALAWEFGDGRVYFPARGQERGWQEAWAAFHAEVGRAMMIARTDLGLDRDG